MKAEWTMKEAKYIEQYKFTRTYEQIGEKLGRSRHAIYNAVKLRVWDRWPNRHPIPANVQPSQVDIIRVVLSMQRQNPTDTITQIKEKVVNFFKPTDYTIKF